MNQILASGIVLARTNYQEADRILTLLTPNHGKVRALAKGVRKSKSKLAGGVELFSISEIGFMRGRGELVTLTSARLKVHYGNIVQDINRTMLGYHLIKLLNKVTEDNPESEYFELLKQLFESLDEPSISTDIIKFWFDAQLLRLAGHTPNLRADNAGEPLKQDKMYTFDFDDMSFLERDNAIYGVNHIKFLRLAFSGNVPRTLQQVQGSDKIIGLCLKLTQTILPNHIRM